MIFVDEIREYKSGKWSHMWTDGDNAELDTFAKQLGLDTDWVHISNGISGRFRHYDLRPSKRAKAIKLGAIEKPLREWIKERVVKQFQGLPELPELPPLPLGIPDENCPKSTCPIMYASNYVICTQCGRNPIPKRNRF